MITSYFNFNFLKIQSIGNDFVVIKDEKISLSKEYISKISKRKTGIGFDQLIYVKDKSSHKEWKIDIYNADGSFAETCGNGIRCVAFIAMQECNTNEIKISTDKHIVFCQKNENNVLINMGKVTTLWEDIPLVKECDTFSLPIFIKNFNNPMCANIGNPHVVFFEDMKKLNLIEKIGPYIESHVLFPEKTNVHIAHIADDENIFVSTWERGSGPTNSCGSGACVVAYLANMKFGHKNKTNIHFKLGTMCVSITKSGEIHNSAPVCLIYKGYMI